MSIWHQLDVREVLEKLGSNPSSGLSDLEASRRLKHYGLNERREPRFKSPWRILWEQLKEVLVMLLIIAAIISAFLGN